MLEWSRENADQSHTDLALEKLESLKARLARAEPLPLAWGDRILDISLSPETLKSLGNEIARLAGVPMPLGPAVSNAPSAFELLGNPLDGSASRIAREIWQDRLKTQGQKSQNRPNTVEACVKSFLASKHAQVIAGKLSAGRHEVLRVHLEHFTAWLGPTLLVSSITGKLVADYHTELLKGLAERKWSVDYAQNRMSAIKTFVRWLWHTEAIEQLPRILDSKELRTGKKLTRPETFEIEEVEDILAAATDRTRLYLLLMLNCGMTQKDISDLKQTEVDWKKGTIKRRRSKTAGHHNVPTVTYRLWPETFRLLQQERATASENVLVNQDGRPLKVEELGKEGRLRKIDNIRSAFNRLARAKKITKPLKLFRKTSATFLRGNKQYTGLENLFLGHSPRTMSDQYYSQVPQELFDEAIEWLGSKLGVVQAR